MKNVLLAITIALASSIVNAQSCPDTSSVSPGIIKPYAPPGWMLRAQLISDAKSLVPQDVYSVEKYQLYQVCGFFGATVLFDSREKNK